MKILVVSDTHKNTEELVFLLEKYASEVEYVCHLGDYGNDLLMYQSLYPQLTMVAVAGNCDEYSGTALDYEIMLTLQGRKFLLVHGHRLGVKNGTDRLAYYALQKGADACFYGHTHFPEVVRHGGLLIINPGSPNNPRGGSKAAYAVVEIAESGDITGNLYLL